MFGWWRRAVSQPIGSAWRKRAAESPSWVFLKASKTLLTWNQPHDNLRKWRKVLLPSMNSVLDSGILKRSAGQIRWGSTDFSSTFKGFIYISFKKGPDLITGQISQSGKRIFFKLRTFQIQFWSFLKSKESQNSLPYHTIYYIWWIINVKLGTFKVILWVSDASLY